MSEFRSFNWLTVAPGEKYNLQVTNLNKEVFSAIGGGSLFTKEQIVNLISIFGKAREGKSYFLNCLADQDGLFKISNSSQPCTQGIDIANKWMDLKDFSSVDGASALSSAAKVGFVDAEGQGDKAVEHDAHVCCPILLLSKCVIFNWKGGLQKDDILSKLGIMARAAASVAKETLDKSNHTVNHNNNNPETVKGVAATDHPAPDPAAKKLFGHLHIVFRDWNSEDCDRNAIYDTLFEREDTVGSHEISSGFDTRNKIRDEILASFESVQVWLFPAPNDNGKVLKTEMKRADMSDEFRDVFREFRSVLGKQLQTPMKFANMPITGSALKLLMAQIVASLNEGNVVVPSGVYKSMLTIELNSALRRMEKDMRHKTTELILSLDAISRKDDFASSYGHSEPEAQRLCVDLLNDIEGAHDMEIKNTICDMSTDFGRDLLNGEHSQYGPSVAESRKILEEYFRVSYREIFTRWLVRAHAEATRIANEQIVHMMLSIDEASKTEQELQEELNIVMSKMKDTIGWQRYDGSDEIATMMESIGRFMEDQRHAVFKHNSAKIEREEAEKARADAEAEAEENRKKRQTAPVVGGGCCSW